MSPRPIARVFEKVFHAAQGLSSAFASPGPEPWEVSRRLHDKLRSGDPRKVDAALSEVDRKGESGGEFVGDVRHILRSGRDRKTIEHAIRTAVALGDAGTMLVEDVAKFCAPERAGADRPMHPRTREMALDSVDELGMRIIETGDETLLPAVARVLPTVAQAVGARHGDVHFKAVRTFRHLGANALERRQEPVASYVIETGLPELEKCMADGTTYGTEIARHLLGDLRVFADRKYGAGQAYV